MIINPLVCTAVFLTFASASASAGVIFYPNDAAAFNVAIAGQTLLGSENWEQSNLASNTLAVFNDSLQPGVSNGPFATGSNIAAGITAQSNSLGANPTTPSPLGVNSLATASTGYFGSPSDQLSANQYGSSLDLIFDPSGGPATAVSLAALFFDFSATSATSHPGTVVISVYDLLDGLLGTHTLTGVDYSQTDFIGIQATGHSQIGRINLFGFTNSDSSVAGADDISVYAVPEPSSSLFTLAGLCLLASRRRH